MGQRRNRVLSNLIGAALLVGVTACGATGSSPSGSAHGSGTAVAASGSQVPLKSGENPAHQVLYGKRRGGALTVYSSADFEHLDPGEAYYTLDYAVMYATQRPLFTYPPDSSTTLVPDLASEMPTTANGGISDGGRTVTVHIQHGVRFSPPVNSEVTSADVAYAIERGANPNVGSAYFIGYFGAGSPTPLQGAQSPKYAGGPIPGIQTPNRYTIVFHLVRPGATFLISALSMPLSAPVPRSYATPMDRHQPTTYGSTYEVATGPYMLQSNLKTGQFSGIGYQTGKSATLVRNPNWDPSTYTAAYRPPAYLNRINVAIGGDANVIGPQVLKGSDAVQLDTPTHSTVKLAYESYPSQLTITPGAGIFYASLDNARGPFANEDLRKAVWAAVDRAAIQRVVGGSLVARPMTHFIYPGTNGFIQAGGYAGPQTDFNRDLTGNMTVARHYMRLAGYADGRYTGNATVQVVGASNGDFPAITQIINQALTNLGFHTHVSQVDASTMYAKYCGVPKLQITVCPSVGWVRDFADPLTVLYETFYGPSIVPTNNANFGQVNDPQINAAMRRAALIDTAAARYQAFANVDRMLVDRAVAIPEYFSAQPNIESANVAVVNDVWNVGSPDFAFTSLKNP